MSVSGIGSSGNGYSIGQMMSRMQIRGSSGESSSSGVKEKPDLSKLVSALDTDSSGSLETSDEIQSLADKIAEATGVSNDLSEFLSTYDTDGDDAISEEEALTALEANPPKGPPPGGMGGPPDETEMVSAADTDSDGVISAEEAESLVEIINNATGSSLAAEDFVGEYDEDGDGSFSLDEAVSAMEANRPNAPPSPPGGMNGSIESEMVSAADTDGDGVISAEEAESLVEYINTATGSKLSVEDFMAEYASDSDTGLTTEEAVAAMEANRPENASGQGEQRHMTAAAMDTYMAMSAMGSQNSGDQLAMMMGGAQESMNYMA